MDNSFVVDGTLPTSYLKISNYLYKELEGPILENRPIIFLCIGTDRATGDSFGPLVGYKIKNLSRKNFYIYGSLEKPIHAENIKDILSRINTNFKNPYIIAIDASLGDFQDIGKIFISHKPIFPGLSLHKDIPSIGDLSITGIINISGSLDFIIIQNTRLFTVMTLADCVSNGIKKLFVEKLNNSCIKTK